MQTVDLDANETGGVWLSDMSSYDGCAIDEIQVERALRVIYSFVCPSMTRSQVAMNM